jgi:uncharacterized cupin superfamily protein
VVAAEPPTAPKDFTELLATSEQTGGALGLIRQTIAPKSGPPAHIHGAEDEFFYVVSGEFKFKLGDRIVSPLGPSSSFPAVDQAKHYLGRRRPPRLKVRIVFGTNSPQHYVLSWCRVPGDVWKIVALPPPP